jgi:hypothetical protein
MHKKITLQQSIEEHHAMNSKQKTVLPVQKGASLVMRTNLSGLSQSIA